ncbi:hypothetical protein SCLCIDRAFT_1214757 [Scleroderma citrinum Foug A]|uniref:Uncharacterized protein n=1 Tax=Scleroderma citrinum Foug A TaxID=1036808 RepID=A0A0C3ACM9_9AGAM|nr:hypothetical protein SCLCIDRAFT_1214757 [Scleroderma citrinum Foug A]
MTTISINDMIMTTTSVINQNDDHNRSHVHLNPTAIDDSHHHDHSHIKTTFKTTSATSATTMKTTTPT